MLLSLFLMSPEPGEGGGGEVRTKRAFISLPVITSSVNTTYKPFTSNPFETEYIEATTTFSHE